MRLFNLKSGKMGKHDPPPQSKVVTSVFTPEVKETPRMPPRNRAERRARHREVVRDNRAEMRAAGRRAHLRRQRHG